MNYISIGAFLLLMFLAYSTVNCFELTEVNVDEISGVLVKPVNWTKEHFNLYKQLRLKVSTVSGHNKPNYVLD